MNKILLVLKREYLTRVKKKSFLLATILTPLIIPAILFALVFFAENSGDKETVLVLDESGYFDQKFSSSRYDFQYVQEELDSAKDAIGKDNVFGVLFIPEIDIENTSANEFKGFAFYAESNPSFRVIEGFERAIRNEIEDLKLEKSGLNQEVIESLKVRVSLDSFQVSDAGEETKSNAAVSYGVGYGVGFLIYIFIFVYGSQIMQSVLDEKSNRIVEVIVSSVKPFQLMMGKVLGLGAVGLTQFLLWIVLIFTLSTVGLSALGVSGGSEQVMEQMASDLPAEAAEAGNSAEIVANVQEVLDTVPIAKIAIMFLFYFIGAYLLYGALYAAVGASVDSIQDAQQFMLPIALPILASIFSMFVVLEDPNGTLAVWLSMIPFTSPIIMMARLPFGVPDWQLILSMALLIGGFVGSIWVAGRIYRVGILMHGVKVNFKVLAKWFTMKV